MEMLILLATLGPLSCLIGFWVGANIRVPSVKAIWFRMLAWFAITALTWFLWPSYSANLAFLKHLLVYLLIFGSGFIGGKTYAKTLRDGQK
jgi:hypothetical protein